GLRQWATKGLSCRWCTSVWVSTVVILAARRLLAQPSYTGGSAIPWSRPDLTLVPSAALATPYVTRWLADHDELGARCPCSTSAEEATAPRAARPAPNR